MWFNTLYQHQKKTKPKKQQQQQTMDAIIIDSSSETHLYCNTQIDQIIPLFVKNQIDSIHSFIQAFWFTNIFLFLLLLFPVNFFFCPLNTYTPNNQFWIFHNSLDY